MWPEIAEAYNPTGVMLAKWKVPSDTWAPYPPNLLISKRATWDMKSEAEVKLAIAVKEMTNRRVFAMDYLPPLGNRDAWWQRRGHAQTLHDNGTNGRTDHRLRQETMDWRIEGIRADKLAAEVRASINARRAGMP